jgi:hypothetical protein
MLSGRPVSSGAAHLIPAPFRQYGSELPGKRLQAKASSCDSDAHPEASGASVTDVAMAAVAASGTADGVEEEMERVRRVRASFTLPFVSLPRLQDSIIAAFGTAVSKESKASSLDIDDPATVGVGEGVIDSSKHTLQGTDAAGEMAAAFEFKNFSCAISLISSISLIEERHEPT